MTRLSEILAETDGTTLRVAARFSGTRLYLPECVQIRDGVLEWSGGVVVKDVRIGRLDGKCLRTFIGLAGGPNAKIASFARAYGPLLLGEHGYPVDQDDLSSRIDEDERPVIGPTFSGRDKPSVWPRVWYREPLEGWCAWARYVGTAFLLSHGLRSGKLYAPDVWLHRAGLDPGPINPELDSPYIACDSAGNVQLSALGHTVFEDLWPRRLCRAIEQCRTADEQWATLADDVSFRLLAGSAYDVRLGGTSQRPGVELGHAIFAPVVLYRMHSALPLIAGQLIASICGDSKMQQCADCGLPYPVTRRRVNGRCPECRPGAHSAAVQRSKAKKRRERDDALRNEKRASVGTGPISAKTTTGRVET